MSNSVKKERKQFIFSIILILLIVSSIVGVIILLSSGKETIITTQQVSDGRNSLVCKNSSDSISPFGNDLGLPVLSEIKIIMINDRMDTISLQFSRVYNSESDARHASSSYVADFNTHLSEYRISPSVLSPRFSSDRDTLFISLYASASAIGPVTSKYFYIGQDEFNKVKSLSAKEMEVFYENKGFSCSIQE